MKKLAAIFCASLAMTFAFPAMAADIQFTGGHGDMFGHERYSNSYPYDMFPPFNDDNGYQPNFVAQPDRLPFQPMLTPAGSLPVAYCRPASLSIHDGDQTRENSGMACLQPDGSWRVVN